MRRELEGWRSVHRRGADGKIESDERVRITAPVVSRSPAGARELGDRYWREIALASQGVVRPHNGRDGIELQLFPRGPSLLAFGHPEVTVDEEGVRCTYPIRGGLLARRVGGSITLSQSEAERPELRATVTGFFPRLAPEPLYDQLQRRIHVHLSRRYFRRLLRDARRWGWPYSVRPGSSAAHSFRCSLRSPTSSRSRAPVKLGKLRAFTHLRRT